MTTTNGGVPAVAFVASGEFVAALDNAAAQHGQTRSHYARQVLAEHLRSAGILAPETPITTHEASRRHRTQSCAAV
ncbi:hypothetical protein JHFBIEKO_4421 [Methylobacterium mesophilicum]|uniref:hypothetical protein n=1 Tax=Methylobacterium mesophilicum TaxID=39956 RepID=UPI001EE31BEC|nr:hypothetical protein [Methylobacterium mesophilicum]GJE23955.1 hypothetical protein JHFBIEKO_4421 [Methylobacterium mesophilicum]